MLIALAVAAAALGFLYWTRGRPERSLYAAIFATGFLMTPSLPVVREKLAAPEVFMLVTWGLVVLQSRRARAPVLGIQKRALMCGAAFIAFGVASWMINVVAVPHGFIGSTVEILNYAYGFLVMATVVHLVDRWEILANCLWAWLAAASVVSAIGVLAVFGVAPGWAYDDFTFRVSSTMKFENQLPSFLLPILPTAIILAVSRPQRLRRRLFLIAVALSGIGTIAMTGSRAGLLMVGLFLAGVLWIAASEGNRPRIHATLITATFAMLAAMQIGISSYALATYEGDYALGRTPPWQRPTVTLYEWATDRGGDLSTIDETRVVQTAFVFDQLAEHAVFGIGPKMVGARFRMEEIHNTYLGVLIEFGLFGTALFLGLIGLVLHTGWRAMIRCHGDLERAIIRALLIGFVLLLFYQFTMFGLRQRNIWILMGLIVALPRVLQTSGLWRRTPFAAG